MKFTKYGPKEHVSPTLGERCPLCGARLALGDTTTVMRRATIGRHAHDSAEVHWDCAASLVGRRSATRR